MKFKRNRRNMIVFFSAVCVVGLFLAVGLKVQDQTPGFQEASTAIEKRTPTRIFSLQENSGNLAQETSENAPCHQFDQTIKKLNLRLLSKSRNFEWALPKPSGCDAVGTRKWLAPYYYQYLMTCFDKPKANPLADEKCYQAVKNFRAVLRDLETRDRALATINDIDLLVDKLTARYAQSPDSVDEVAKRLLELNPKMYAPRKALVFSQFREALLNSESPDFQNKWDKFTRALGDLQNNYVPSGKESEQLDQLRVIANLSKGKTGPELQSAIDSYRKSNPDSVLGEYFAAWSAYRMGNRDAALSFLGQCVKREPDNKLYQYTLSRVAADPTTGSENAFALMLQPNFDVESN